MNKHIPKTTWLVDEQWIKDNSFIDFNLHGKYINIAMQFIQDDLITRILGSCLAAHIQHLVETNKIHLKHYTEYDTIIRDYISYIFVWGIPLMVNIPLTFQTRNSGVIQLTGEGFQTMNPVNDLKQINAWYKTNMDMYINRLIEYLQSIKPKLQKDLKGCNIPCLHVDNYVHTLKPNYYPLTQYQLWRK